MGAMQRGGVWRVSSHFVSSLKNQGMVVATWVRQCSVVGVACVVTIS